MSVTAAETNVPTPSTPIYCLYVVDDDSVTAEAAGATRLTSDESDIVTHSNMM